MLEELPLVDTLKGRLTVQPPYFSFRTLRQLEADTVEGVFLPEQPVGRESGPIGAAEIGRHLAILGTCAAALHADERYYYLATKARMQRAAARSETRRQPLKAQAKLLEKTSRRMVAQTRLFLDEGPADLTVEYVALSEPVFKRTFRKFHRAEQASLDEATYRDLKPARVIPSGDDQQKTVMRLSPKDCAGHFDNYPAWPVAIIGYYAVDAATGLLCKRLGEERRFTLLEYQLEAKHLVPAETELVFTATCLHMSSGGRDATTQMVAHGPEGLEVANITAHFQIA